MITPIDREQRLAAHAARIQRELPTRKRSRPRPAKRQPTPKLLRADGSRMGDGHHFRQALATVRIACNKAAMRCNPGERPDLATVIAQVRASLNMAEAELAEVRA